MSKLGFLRSVVAAAFLATGALVASSPADAQTVGTRIPVGLAPAAIAVNPVTNKVYVANDGSDNVTVINATTGATSTIAAGDRPMWVAINVETNTVYVSNFTSANTTVINGATDTVTATALSGGGGWTAINPLNNTAYVIRVGTADEVNTIVGSLYKLTSATRSHQPVSLAVNPVNNRLYMAHVIDGDIVAMDMTTSVPYPPLLCPDGAGGFRPQPAEPIPGQPVPDVPPCIDVPNPPVAVAINPVTNTIYALNNATSQQVSVISGENHTFTSLTPTLTGGLGAAKTIAVNPVTNRIYAAFRNAVVVVNGATNAMTVIPTGSAGGGPAAIGINVLTNTVFVPNSDGSMLVINGATNATTTVSIATGANGIAVNPLTNTAFVLDSGGGVTPVTGPAGSATSTGITTTIQALPGNQGPTSGSISLDAASTMTPAPLDAVRKVYYRIGTSGPWTEATGTGPYTATYSGLSAGSHTIQAFATNSLESPNINTDLANVPVTGNVASYTFTVSAAVTQHALSVTKSGTGSGTVTSTPAGIDCGATCTFNFNSGTAVTLTATPASGSVFAGWTGGGCSGTGTCVVTVNAAQGVSATFNSATASDPARLVNISTRMQVLTGNDVMIGGFIIGGSVNKTVVVRARGPSLAAFGIANPLANPTMQLVRSSDGAILATNNDWQSAPNAAAISSSGFAPSNSLESAILVNLPPGAYTAIVSGVSGGTGIGIVEVFEVDNPAVPLINISTRGQVRTGNDVMIGGFIIQGSGPQTVVIRARGPSLAAFGITNPLADPRLQLVRSSDQSTVAINDDWRSAPNSADITAAGFAPSNDFESAIMVTLQPGAYTAIVTGVGGGTGVGIVEVFRVQ